MRAILAAIVVVACAAAVRGQASPCANFGSVTACAAAAAQSSPILCVWSDSQGCAADPCTQLSNVTCGSTTGCVYMGWLGGGFKCFSASLLCTNLGVQNCDLYSFCTKKDNAYCTVVGILGTNTVTTECDVKFPTWSIALLFVWLILMVIFGFIIFLAMGKAKGQKVKGVEKDDDVVVDGTNIRDNFQLGEPLNTGTDE